ncbi:TonB-dependent SusC/RagA subfamily outer membrane receptor, partial [Chitinophaga sp. S165]
MLLCLLVYFTAGAQHNLSQSRRSSVYEYLYELSNDETLQIYTYGIHKVNASFLHTLRDSFPHDNQPPGHFPPGNYLRVYAENDKLQTVFTPVPNVCMKQLHNARDLIIILHNEKGEPVKTADMRMGKYPLQYDAKANSYRLEKYEKGGILQVYHQGVLNCFTLAQTKSERKRTIRQRASYPFRFMIWYLKYRPKQRKYYKKHYSNSVAAQYQKKHPGYIVFNKPKFKPGDTVKLKAFITDEKGTPVNKPLLLRLSDQDFDVDTILTNLAPYSPGAYTYEFVCSPDLDLALDKDYQVTLETTDSRKYNKANFDGKVDIDEYAAKRPVLKKGAFRSEEYELHSLTFQARTDRKSHGSKQQMAVYCQAKDENNLPVMDGSITMFVIREKVIEYYEKRMSIPDTLWQYSGQMDQVGETKILIPDSIFPKADLKYSINCIFTNSNNETRTFTLHREYTYKNKNPFIFSQDADSLYITTDGASQTAQRAYICGLNDNKDTIETASITLPGAVKINPFASVYICKNEYAEDKYFPDEDDGQLEYDISWANDTVIADIKNPQKLFFWYWIFERNKVLERGYTNRLTWKAVTQHKEQYELRTNYIWNGVLKKDSVYFTDPGNQLDISVSAPKEIYPGQTTKVSLNVKDKYLKPVANADLTMYAHTSKFNADEPLIPDFLPRFQKRKWYQSPRYTDLEELEEEEDLRKALAIDWEKYRGKMGLDSLLFFQFTHPSPFFIYREPALDTVTQIAPFVFSGGSLQPVHIVYVDEIPRYCSFADPLQGYSIRVSPGDHNITLRTAHQRLSFNMTIPAGLKTFISIDSAINKKYVLVEAMPTKLTPSELTRINKYMLRVLNTFRDYGAYIRQDEKLLWLNIGKRNHYAYQAEYIAGPLTGNKASLIVKDSVVQDFTPEPGYSFEINKGLIKQKQLQETFPDYKDLRRYNTDTSLSAMAWSDKMADSLIHLLQLNNVKENDLVKLKEPLPVNTKLVVDLAQSDLMLTSEILQLLFFRYDNPSYVKSYNGAKQDFSDLDTGYYRLVVLLTDRRYFITDSLFLKKDHLHYYAPDSIHILPEDSMSIELDKQLKDIADAKYMISDYQRNRIAESFNKRKLTRASLKRLVSGIVLDSKGDPLPGVAVTLRGTIYGCTTDANGRFQLSTTDKGYLEARLIGFSPTEQPLDENKFYKITMTDVVMQLKETVIIAYGFTTKRYNTGNATRLRTEVLPHLRAPQIASRNSLPPVTGPLIIIDGVPFEGTLNDLAEGSVKSITKLTDADANAIYGSRAAFGVFIVTTRQSGDRGKDELRELSSRSGLRANFRDDAFWQPRLKTDENGNASFKVTFPDDITSWDAYAIAMTDKKQVGMRKIQIRSFKTLSGNLGLPAFAVAGDTIHIISKALNYTPDSIRGVHTFSVNDSTYFSHPIIFKNALIDTTPVYIRGTDSVGFKYVVNKEGYMDGEQRKIPLIRRGTSETTGMFVALHNDTSFSYQYKRPDPVMIRVESAIMPVLMNEIEQVQQYRYLCNEQLASKLKTYLLEKKVAAYLKKDFKKDNDIKEILKRLDQQKKNGLWGWWENSPVSVWISRHVIESLLMAEDQGYKTGFNKQVAIDYFVDELNSGKKEDRIGCMLLLAKLGANISYKEGVDSIISRSGKSGYDTIRLAMLQQQAGIPVNFSAILAGEKNTVFGNAYWGSESYHLFDNSIQKTLQVYKLLRKAGGYEPLLQKIRGYFLEQRKDGHWRNTYESALILETILPDVLEDESHGPAAIDINGRHITQFPYTDTLTYTEKINISKQGKRPVYFTAYQQFFNTQPEKVSGLFNVSSVFSVNGTTQTDLKAGVPVTLKVEVKVQKTADYVLIEIPIPAGCSYNDKSQAWANNEVHREHFKDRVSIFCSQLSPGTHTFNVSLLPRYSGSYHLNPAKAEMQYFPVFMG